MTTAADHKFRFRLDRRAQWLTITALAVIATGVGGLFYVSGGSYLPAWFSTVVVASLLLAALSIPRFMRVSPHSVEVHCLLELVKIPIREIRYVRFIEPGQMRFCLPIWGIYGIGGYYGYFFNLRERRICRVYASQWRNFVRIETVDGGQYVVSCDDPATFVERIEQFR